MDSAMTEDLSRYVYEHDQYEFSFGDVLDVKTGLILAALTFLAIQSGELIKPGLPLGQAIAQAFSILALVCGGIASVLELLPRDYSREATPDEYDKWIIETEVYHRAYPDIPVETLSSARLAAAKQRVAENSDNNQKKSAWMFQAFWCTVAAFAANIVTLAMRLF